MHTDKLQKQLSELDSGAVSNFLRTRSLHRECLQRLQQGPAPDVRDINRQPVQIEGILRLQVQLGTIMVEEEFFVCDRLNHDTRVHFSHHVMVIYPKYKQNLLQDGFTHLNVR